MSLTQCCGEIYGYGERRGVGEGANLLERQFVWFWSVYLALFQYSAYPPNSPTGLAPMQ